MAWLDEAVEIAKRGRSPSAIAPISKEQFLALAEVVRAARAGGISEPWPRLTEALARLDEVGRDGLA